MSASKVQGGTATQRAGGDPASAAVGRPLATSRAAAMRPGSRALPEHTRSHNRALVLQALYRCAGLSRADLAREVGLTRVTISDLVSELITEGLAVELGRRADSRPGKPATLLDINRSGFSIVGLDLSVNSVFRGVVTDLDGTVLARAQIDTEGVTGAGAVDIVTSLVDTLIESAHTPILGIGVGSPGVVNADGTVLSAPNLGWSDVPLQDILSDHTGLPIQVANDANTAALAERTFGTGSPGDTMLVRIGRGVGSGVVISGSPVYGSNFAAGEIGHVVVGTDGGERCVCGKDGCLETWLATPRLEAKLALAADDEARAAVLREAGQRLGIALAPIVGALNLGEVVLSGPLALLDGTLLEGAAETLRNRTMADFHGDLTLRMTSLGGDIVVLGAVVMVLTGQLGVS